MTEETIFQEALSRSPAERASFLLQACAGRPDLLAAVEALLAAHAKPGNILDKPPRDLVQTLDSDPGAGKHGATGEYSPQPAAGPPQPAAPTADYRPDLEPGLVIAGRYTLQQKLGEGGMGEVWVAKQTEPVKRKVAIKLIKTGMDSKAVLARFEQERQALAMMDHLNIARVLDGGMTPKGQPFFVMELVNGLPLNKFCDEARLTPKERLELFVPICQAVQHAHQKGIVHRDLTPSNILVTLMDAQPVPKVIDFGLAKATAGRLTDASMSTHFGAVVGTLEYMSPEQAGFSGEDIDTRADIYSLGVILYELLTGLRPVDAKRLKNAAMTEMIRIIQEEEPSKPSTRLSTDESLPSLAALRQIEPKKLMALLRGELDWVVMKCLEKRRDRRYETANGLARDVQRYLADEPVEARPPSAGYRLNKFLKRHKGPVVAAGLVLCVLLAGIAGTTWGLVEARRQEKIARGETAEKEEARQAEAARAEGERLAKMDAEAKQAEAERQKSRAEASEKLASKRLIQVAAEKTKSTRQLALFYIGRGIKELEHGDKRMGLAILGQAYRAANAANDAGLRRSICNLLGTWQSTCENRLFLEGRDRWWEVAFSPDRTKVTCFRRDLAKAHFWDAVTGQPLDSPMKHGRTYMEPGIVEAAVSPDGTKVATFSNIDNTVRLWDAATDQPLGAPMKHKDKVNTVVFSPDGTKVATFSNVDNNMNMVRVWDAATDQPLGAPMKHEGPVDTVVFSPDGTMVTTVSRGAVRIWDVATGQPLRSPKKYDDLGRRFFSPDGTKFVMHFGGIYENGDWTAQLWDVATGQPLGEPMRHEDFVDMMVFSPDGLKVATGSRDKTARLWDAATGKPLGLTMKHGGEVLAGAFSPDGMKLATASFFQPGGLWVWNVATGRAVALQKEGYSNGMTGAVFSPDCTKVAANNILLNSALGELQMWDAVKGKPLGRMFHGEIATLAFSPDGTKVITADGGTTQLWHAATGEPLGKPMKHGGRVGAATFSSDSTKVATASEDMTARLWDAATGKPLGLPMKHDGQVLAVTFSPHGAKVATASEDKTARLWDAATGIAVGLPMTHDGQVLALAFSPDGTKLATAGNDKAARLWDAATGRPLGLPMRHDGPVRAVTFSPDGAKVATASEDETARLWDAATGKSLGALMAHQGKVQAVVFSPDGTKLATAGAGKTARLWDATTGTPLCVPMEHDGQVLAVAFSPDGAKLATACEDNTLRMWPVFRPLPDDAHFVTAYVDATSGWKEDEESVLRPISDGQSDGAWHEVQQSFAWPEYLRYRREDAERRARAWHENEADAAAAGSNWFAAAFHLRWLCQMEPKNTEWQQRLAEAKGFLAGPGLGPPRPLVNSAAEGTWSPDGERIAFAHVAGIESYLGPYGVEWNGPHYVFNGIGILKLASKAIEVVTKTGRDPAWSPGEGRFIAFTDKRNDDKEDGIWVVDLGSMQAKRVATGVFAGWLADGKTVCYRTSMDGKPALQSLDVTGDKAMPKTLLNDVCLHAAISPDGQYVAEYRNSELQIWSIARKEIVDRHPLPGWDGTMPSWSPDNRQIAFGTVVRVESKDLWIYDVRSHRATKFLAGPYALPRWSADGNRMCVDIRPHRNRFDEYVAGSAGLSLLELKPCSIAVRRQNLALEYQAAGKLDLALPLFEEALKLMKTTPGPEDPATLECMYNLAKAYQAAGKLDLALPLFEEALKLMKATLGLEHPDTLQCMNGLAETYQAAGKRDLALPLFEETLKLMQAIKLGPEHPYTLASMNCLAKAYQVAGKLELAIPLFEEELTLMKKKLGIEHPDTLECMDSLAAAYQAAGKLDLALPLFEQAYPGSKKDPARRWVGTTLLDDYMRIGKTGKAVALTKELRADARTQVPQVGPQLIEQLDGKLVALGQRSGWSPDGNQIVFSHNGILVCDIATNKITPVATDGLDAAWAEKDGRWIAYVAGSEPTIWVAEVPTGKPFRVSAGYMPSWSSDGKTLFFEVFGRNQLMSTEVTGNGQFSPPRVRSEVPYEYPIVSPDGRRVAYKSGGDLVIQQLDDGKVAKRFVLPQGNGMLGGWSPDSREFGFGGWNADDPMPCIILNVETGMARQVASRWLTMPAWSPDGSKITFDLRLGSGTEIWMIAAEAIKKLPTFKMETR